MKSCREVEPLSENVYRVSGKTNVERLFESLGYEQEFDVQTVSGWIMELLERIPEAGDTVDYREHAPHCREHERKARGYGKAGNPPRKPECIVKKEKRKLQL